MDNELNESSAVIEDFDLSSYVGSREYEPYVSDDVVASSEEVTLVEPDETQGDDAEATASAPEAAPPTTDQPQGEAPAQTGFAPTAPPMPDPRVAELETQVQRYESALRQQVQNSLRIDQERFEEGLRDLTEDEQRAARAERSARIQAARAEIATRQLQTVQSQQQAVQQEAAKGQVAYLMMQRDSLPQEAYDILLAAPTPEAMELLSQRMSGFYRQNRAQQVEAQPAQQQPTEPLHPNARVAGGRVAPSAPTKDVKPRSGDILGLIASTEYTYGHG